MKTVKSILEDALGMLEEDLSFAEKALETVRARAESYEQEQADLLDSIAEVKRAIKALDE